MPLLEEVFKTSDVPTYTFVKPQEYSALLLGLRSPGRGVVVEGPSGIGKTTSVENALRELGIEGKVTKLSSRKPEDIEYIKELPNFRAAGIVVVDDFHKLPNEVRSGIADYMKIRADEEATDVKVIVLGINKAGENLISFAYDLVNRLDVIRFETNPDYKVEALVQQGETALNVEFNVEREIVAAAQGSFYLAQMLCREICMEADILTTPPNAKVITISFEAIKARIWERLGRSFRDRCERFCRGTRLRKEGRAPYLHILNWLAQSNPRYCRDA